MRINCFKNHSKSYRVVAPVFHTHILHTIILEKAKHGVTSSRFGCTVRSGQNTIEGEYKYTGKPHLNELSEN